MAEQADPPDKGTESKEPDENDKSEIDVCD